VALTYDKASGIARMFVNGDRVKEQSLGSFTMQTSYNLYLGNRPSGTAAGNVLYGLMDEVGLYNRALQPDEVRAIFASGELGKCKPPTLSYVTESHVAFWGKNTRFEATATGKGPFSYQWAKDGTSIAGATNSVLELSDLEMSAAGVYTVTVSNAYGSTTSVPRVLVMNPAGVSIATYAGVTIDGVVGKTYGIQYSTNLNMTNLWFGLTNVSLTNPVQLWLDLEPIGINQRYYQVVPGPIPTR
jgi:hypothetical protein